MFQISRQGDDDAAGSVPGIPDGRTPTLAESEALLVLGLPSGASWPQIEQSYRQLVSDLTPGPDASHRNVELALHLLDEVNTAYRSLHPGAFG